MMDFSSLNSMNISASGLTAQRTVMDVIANNIANADTTRTPTGGPYRREIVELAPVGTSGNFASALNQAISSQSAPVGGGVQVVGIVQDGSPFPTQYDPTSPDAVNGYVEMPNVNISTEMVDMAAATQAYQANVTAFDSAKQMNVDALSLGK